MAWHSEGEGLRAPERQRYSAMLRPAVYTMSTKYVVLGRYVCLEERGWRLMRKMDELVCEGRSCSRRRCSTPGP